MTVAQRETKWVSFCFRSGTEVKAELSGVSAIQLARNKVGVPRVDQRRQEIRRLGEEFLEDEVVLRVEELHDGNRQIRTDPS